MPEHNDHLKPWLTVNDLLGPDWNLTEETLFAHVVAGRLVAYEDIEGTRPQNRRRVEHPVEEPCGVRRLMPTEEMRERYEALIRK